jgi:hypothetical protein
VDPQTVDLRRREFLLRFCQGAGASLIPTSLWGLASPNSKFFASRSEPAVGAGFHLQPHYRTERPLDATLLKVQAGSDEFITEKYAAQIAAVLGKWSASLLRSPGETKAVANALAPDFSGAALQPAESRVVRSDPTLQIRQNKFTAQATLNRDDFLREWKSRLSFFSKIMTAEFQITKIEATKAEDSASRLPERLQTRVRYEITGTGAGFHREQRVGNWDMAGSRPLRASFFCAVGKRSTKLRLVPVHPFM